MNRFGLYMKQKVEPLLERYLSGNSMDYRQIIALLIPIFVDTAFIIFTSLLNTAMVSSSGMAAVSAVSMVDSLNMFIISVFVALATGGTVIVAQYKGSGNDSFVSKAAAQAVTTVTAAAIVISVLVLFFHDAALELLFGNAEADVLGNAKIYLIGSCISFPFMAMYQAVTGVLRGVAETKPALVLSVILNLTLFLFNFIFIVLLDMGVLGLSISVNIARIAGVSAAVIYLLKYNQTLYFTVKNALRIDPAMIKKMLYVGVPFAAEQLFFNGGKLLTQTFIVQLGTLALTVNAIGNSISNVFNIGSQTLSIAIVTVVGQCLGRKDIQDARKFVKSFLWISAVWFVVAAAVILPLFPQLMKLFAAPDEIIPTIFTLMVIIAVTQPFLWAASFMLPSALRAGGDSRFTSITSLLTMWLLRVILGYVLGITLGFGIVGVWTAMVIEWGVRGLIFWLRFRGEKWYAHKLI